MPPPVGARAFIRPRLHSRLVRRFDLRIINVVAGAGFGKTTMLAQAVAENLMDPLGRDVWIGCDQRDSSTSSLCAAALRGIGGGDAVVPPMPTVDDVANAVWSCAPEQICLVVDDVHVIESGSDGERALAALLTSLPTNGHLVIAGRDRRIPVTRLLAQGAADEMTEHDLSFDEADLTRLAHAHGLEPGALGDVGLWPALVELTAAASGADSGRTVAAKFVGEEVLAEWSLDDRVVLHVVAMIGGADVETIEAIFERPIDIGPFRRLPLTAVDQAGVVRPHSLWADLLADTQPSHELTRWRARAAVVLRKRGLPGTAYELLAGSEQWDEALPVLFDACNDQRNPPAPDVMQRWLSLVPSNRRDAPESVYAAGMVARGGDPWAPEAKRLLAAAVVAFREAGDTRREWIAAVRLSYVTIVTADEEWHIRERRDAARLTGAGVATGPTDGLSETFAALIAGRYEEAAERAGDVPDVEPRLRHFRGFCRSLAAAGLGQWMQRSWIDDSANAAAAVRPAAGTGWAATLPAAAAMYAGRLSDAIAATVGDVGREYPISERVPSLCVSALVHAQIGDVETARQFLRSAEQLLVPKRARPLADGYLATAAAAIALAVGDEASAAMAIAAPLRTRAGELAPAPMGEGLAFTLFPAHPYLTNADARRWLAGLPEGPHRRRVIDACDALLAARAGGITGPPALLDDKDALVATVGIGLAVELVVRTAGRYRAAEIIGGLADRWPSPTRDALRRLDHTDCRADVASLSATIPIPPTVAVGVEFLGSPRFVVDGDAVDSPNWRRLRVRQLLACLVVQRSIRRQRVADLLWPDATEESASSNLRMTLTYLQSLLQPDRDRGHAPWFIQQDAGMLVLRERDELHVDVWSFDAAIDDAARFRRSGQPSDELAALSTAVGLWRGEPFAGMGDDQWIADARRRLCASFVTASVRCCALALAAGRWSLATEVAERALATAPWELSLHTAAIHAARDAEDGPGSRYAIERARTVLDELGIGPDDDLARELARA